VIDLSSDLDTLNASLMDFRAHGGGDGPESVNRALYDAVHGISWIQDRNTYRVIFLIGDAPPHMDYQDEVGYASTLALAEQRGIVVNTIQCGGDALTRSEWLRIAQLGRGQAFQVEQAGGAVALVTPFDRSLAELSSRLDATRLYYGDAGQQARQREKQQAAAKFNEQSSVESRARRATFNASPSGAVNLLGPQELIEDVSNGKLDLSKVESDRLPAPLRNIPSEARKEFVEKAVGQRAELTRQIDGLARQRADYLRQQVEQQGGGRDSLDRKIYEAVREQAEDKGLLYRAEEPADR
jgi:hypothetical protein